MDIQTKKKYVNRIKSNANAIVRLTQKSINLPDVLLTINKHLPVFFTFILGKNLEISFKPYPEICLHIKEL